MTKRPSIDRIRDLPGVQWDTAFARSDGTVRVDRSLRWFFSQYARQYRQEHPGIKLWSATMIEHGLPEFASRGLVKLVNAQQGYLDWIPTDKFWKVCLHLEECLKPSWDGTTMTWSIVGGSGPPEIEALLKGDHEHPVAAQT